MWHPLRSGLQAFILVISQVGNIDMVASTTVKSREGKGVGKDCQAGGRTFVARVIEAQSQARCQLKTLSQTSRSQRQCHCQEWQPTPPRWKPLPFSTCHTRLTPFSADEARSRHWHSRHCAALSAAQPGHQSSGACRHLQAPTPPTHCGQTS